MVHTFLILDGHPTAFASTVKQENALIEPKGKEDYLFFNTKTKKLNTQIQNIIYRSTSTLSIMELYGIWHFGILSHGLGSWTRARK
jgi:hypothetical protein